MAGSPRHRPGFGSAADIEQVVLSARHSGTTLESIDEFPFFVHIAVPSVTSTPLTTPMRADELTIIGWGELYRTRADAEAHRFD